MGYTDDWVACGLCLAPAGDGAVPVATHVHPAATRAAILHTMLRGLEYEG